MIDLVEMSGQSDGSQPRISRDRNQQVVFGNTFNRHSGQACQLEINPGVQPVFQRTERRYLGHLSNQVHHARHHFSSSDSSNTTRCKNPFFLGKSQLNRPV